MVREAQRKQRQAIDKYNRDVRQHNQKIEREHQKAVSNYNAEVRRYNQSVKRAIDKYNQAVRTHNAQVRRDEQARKRQLAALQSRPTVRVYETLRSSTYDLNASFERLDQQAHAYGVDTDLFGLSERESQNSMAVMDALLAPESEAVPVAVEEDTGIVECLAGFSQDLCDRWRGAAFALNPSNPDAARHFCTSVREIFTEILDQSAPDAEVEEADPGCQMTQQGKPSRRAKIDFLLRLRGPSAVALGDFADTNVSNILELFKVFNEATHGAAGKHSHAKLKLIKKRVEDGIMFLATIAAPEE